MKGAYKASSKDRWISQIRIDGKLIYLGTFDNEQEAQHEYSRVEDNHDQGEPLDIKTRKKSSTIKGVSWSKGHCKWIAQGYRDGRQKYLGSYSREEDAGEAVKEYYEKN